MPNYFKGNTRVFYGAKPIYGSNFGVGTDGWSGGTCLISGNQINFNNPLSTGWLGANLKPSFISSPEFIYNNFSVNSGSIYRFISDVDINFIPNASLGLGNFSPNSIGICEVSASPNIIGGSFSTGIYSSGNGAFSYLNSGAITHLDLIFQSINPISGAPLVFLANSGSPSAFVQNQRFSLKNISFQGPFNEVLPNMPSPLIDITEDAIMVGGNVWGTKKNITLRGEVNMNNANEFWNIQRYLLTTFAANFGSLLIYDNYYTPTPTLALQESNCYISSIDFPESRYQGIGNYVINLYSYPTGFYQNFGVLDVKDEWSFEENGDYLLNISRTYGAKGFNTSSDSYNNAYDNAYNYTLNYINTDSVNPFNLASVTPQFITDKVGALGYVPFLISRNETSNRFRGEYFVTETYKADLFYNQLGILRYKIDVSEPFAGFRVCTIDGEYIGSRDASFATLRSAFLAIDFTNKALTTEPLLNPATLEKNISENQLSKSIKFSFRFNSDKQPNIIQDITTSVSSLIDITKIQVNGEIKSKKMSYAGWSGVSGAFANLNIFDLAATEYVLFFTGSSIYPLNPTPESQSSSQNQNENTISFNYTYNNNKPPSNNFEIINIKKDVSVPVRQIKPNIIISDMSYYFTDMGIDTPRRTKITANGLAKESIININALSELGLIMSGYLEGGGELEQFDQNQNNQSQYSITQTYIYPAAASLTNYSGVVL